MADLLTLVGPRGERISYTLTRRAEAGAAACSLGTPSNRLSRFDYTSARYLVLPFIGSFLSCSFTAGPRDLFLPGLRFPFNSLLGV